MAEFVSTEARTLYYLKTVILQSKRRKLKITVNQYAMLDIIDHFLEKHGSMTKQELREMVDTYGIENPVQEFKILKKMELAYMSKVDGKVIVHLTGKWKSDTLPDDYKERFEELWEDYGRVGNKKKSLEAFVRFLKSGESYDNLIGSYWPSYKKYLTTSSSSQLHLSTFLNPDNERYLDEWKSNAHFSKANQVNTPKEIIVEKRSIKSSR